MISIFNPSDPAQPVLNVPEKVFTVCYAPAGFKPITDPAFWSTIGENVPAMPAEAIEAVEASEAEAVEAVEAIEAVEVAPKRKGRPKKGK